MSLIEYDLIERKPEDKVNIAIARLRLHEPPKGYDVADSYGKDSCVIRELCRLAGVKHTLHHARTTLDPPELMRFGRRFHPETVEVAPTERFEMTLLSKGFPPLRNQRWCCETLKEGHGKGIIVTGVRQKESRWRKSRGVFEACYKDKGPASEKKRHFLNPIVDWATEDVWEFIRDRSIPYCELYDRGHTRLGCLMCPCAGRRRRLYDSIMYPRFTRRYIRAFQRLVELRQSGDRKPLSWGTGEELFTWWITEPRKVRDVPGQQMLFEGEDDEP